MSEDTWNFGLDDSGTSNNEKEHDHRPRLSDETEQLLQQILELEREKVRLAQKSGAVSAQQLKQRVSSLKEDIDSMKQPKHAHAHVHSKERKFPSPVRAANSVESANFSSNDELNALNDSSDDDLSVSSSSASSTAPIKPRRLDKLLQRHSESSADPHHLRNSLHHHSALQHHSHHSSPPGRPSSFRYTSSTSANISSRANSDKFSAMAGSGGAVAPLITMPNALNYAVTMRDRRSHNTAPHLSSGPASPGEPDNTATATHSAKAVAGVGSRDRRSSIRAVQVRYRNSETSAGGNSSLLMKLGNSGEFSDSASEYSDSRSTSFDRFSPDHQLRFNGGNTIDARRQDSATSVSSSLASNLAQEQANYQDPDFAHTLPGPSLSAPPGHHRGHVLEFCMVEADWNFLRARDLPVFSMVPPSMIYRYPPDIIHDANSHTRHIQEQSFFFPSGVQVELVPQSVRDVQIRRYHHMRHIVPFTNRDGQALYACCLTVVQSYTLDDVVRIDPVILENLVKHYQAKYAAIAIQKAFRAYAQWKKLQQWTTGRAAVTSTFSTNSSQHTAAPTHSTTSSFFYGRSTPRNAGTTHSGGLFGAHTSNSSQQHSTHGSEHQSVPPSPVSHASGAASARSSLNKELAQQIHSAGAANANAAKPSLFSRFFRSSNAPPTAPAGSAAPVVSTPTAPPTSAPPTSAAHATPSAGGLFSPSGIAAEDAPHAKPASRMSFFRSASAASTATAASSTATHSEATPVAPATAAADTVVASDAEPTAAAAGDADATTTPQKHALQPPPDHTFDHDDEASSSSSVKLDAAAATPTDAPSDADATAAPADAATSAAKAAPDRPGIAPPELSPLSLPGEAPLPRFWELPPPPSPTSPSSSHVRRPPRFHSRFNLIHDSTFFFDKVVAGQRCYCLISPVPEYTFLFAMLDLVAQAEAQRPLEPPSPPPPPPTATAAATAAATDATAHDAAASAAVVVAVTPRTGDSDLRALFLSQVSDYLRRFLLRPATVNVQDFALNFAVTQDLKLCGIRNRVLEKLAFRRGRSDTTVATAAAADAPAAEPSATVADAAGGAAHPSHAHHSTPVPTRAIHHLRSGGSRASSPAPPLPHHSHSHSGHSHSGHSHGGHAGHRKYALRVRDYAKVTHAALDELVPTAEWAVAVLITHVSAPTIFKMVNLLLMEKSLIIYGRHAGVVTAITFAIAQLLSPFLWEGIFIPLVPDNAREMFGAPVPLLLGTTSPPRLADVSSSTAVLHLNDHLATLHYDNVRVVPGGSVNGGHRRGAATAAAAASASASASVSVAEKLARVKDVEFTAWFVRLPEVTADLPVDSEIVKRIDYTRKLLATVAKQGLHVLFPWREAVAAAAVKKKKPSPPAADHAADEVAAAVAAALSSSGEAGGASLAPAATEKATKKNAPRPVPLADETLAVRNQIDGLLLQSMPHVIRTQLRIILSVMKRYNATMCGTETFYDDPATWKRFLRLNPVTQTEEFYPDNYLEPLRSKLEFQDAMVHTQLFVSFMDRLRREAAVLDQVREFIGHWIYCRIVVKRAQQRRRDQTRFRSFIVPATATSTSTAATTTAAAPPTSTPSTSS
eukprot:gene8045-5791_t